MAEAASSLSSEYYAHKRASLLASAALLVVSQPDASFREVSVAMPLTLGPGATILLEAGLAATTLYYIVHFCTLWFHEAFAFTRKEAGALASLDEQAGRTVAELKARGAELAGRAQQIATAMTVVQQGVTLPGDQSAS